MLDIFGKKKNKKAEQKKENAVDTAMEQSKQRSQTLEALSDNRNTHEQIEAAFSELLRDPGIAQASFKAACANEQKLEKLRAAAEEMDASDNSNAKASKLWDMEKDIYIVPGGYSELPSDTNDIPKNNLDVYNRAIEGLARGFKQKTVAEAVSLGADKLDGFMLDFISNLRNAMETGRAMKANACIDMIRYVLVVGYRHEDATDPEKFRERIQKKVDFISGIGKHLIESIDYYYKLLTDYELDEAAYARDLREFDQAIEPYQSECPPDVKQKLERLGFKRAMSELPAGDDARKYIGILLAAESYLTKSLIGSLRLEALSMEILRERGNIQELVNECKRAFSMTGDDFDYNKHIRVIEEIRRKNIDEINKINDMVAEQSRQDEEMHALVEEAAQNQKLANAAANAVMVISKYDSLQERNENLRRNEEKQRAAYMQEKERLKNEEEERQRLEKLEQEAEPIENEAQIIDAI